MSFTQLGDVDMGYDIDMSKVKYKVKTVQKIKNSYGFRIVFTLADGSTVTHQKSGFSSPKEAENVRKRIDIQLEDGTYLFYSNVLFKDYVVHWLEDVIRVKKTYSTYYSYNSVIRKHIIPRIGNKRVGDLNSADMVRLYKSVAEYSVSVAKQVRTIMKTVLAFAVTEKALEVNVAEMIPLPISVGTVPYHSRRINAEKTLTHEQVLTLIRASKGTKIYLMVMFAVIMGLRCSEIIAVKYENIDFAKQKLYIKNQLGIDPMKPKKSLPPKTYTKQEIAPKTASSVRVLDIPDSVFKAILEEREKYEAHKRRRPNSFQDLGYVCCSSYGRPRSRGYHFQTFKKLLRDNNLPDIRWHDLRATSATLLLAAEFNAKVVAKQMGHAKEIVTVDVYGNNHMITVTKLSALDEYVEAVTPRAKENDYSECVIDIGAYL